MLLGMTILAIALMSASVSQTLSSQHQIERIKAEQLAKGAFWYNYLSISTLGSSSSPLQETLDNKPYTPTVSSSGADPFGYGTTTYNATVSY